MTISKAGTRGDATGSGVLRDEGETYEFENGYSLDGFTAGDDSHDGGPVDPEQHKVWDVWSLHGTGGNDTADWSDLAHDVKMYGYAGDDTFQAGHGDDIMIGGLGDDQMSGNDGFDTIVGGEGDDWIDGGGEDDEIHDGSGVDTIVTGTGDDTVFLTDDDLQDTLYFTEWMGTDVIDGFEAGVDLIVLSGFGISDFNELTDHMTYNGDGQVLIDLGMEDALIFTNIDGALGWDDFVLN